MKRKLIITRIENKIWSALFEDEKVAELSCTLEEEKKSYSLGDIYVGKVKKIVPNIQAAFVEIAPQMECYYALTEHEAPVFTNKKVGKTLCVGDELLVQISKEATKTKVPSVSSKLNFTGKYAVLTVGDTRIGVSGKIEKSDRERLQKLAHPFVTEAFGFILRTNARDAQEDAIVAEIEQLILEYQQLIETGKTRLPYTCLKESEKQYLTKVLDIYQNGQVEIIVEEKDLYDEISCFLQKHQPKDLENLKLYKDSLLSLHKLYSIETHIERALKEYVWLKSGAYIVIQPTEALTVIDVNTGKCVTKKKDNDAVLKSNLEAATEAARQIRLRNLSGIILIDFINLDDAKSMQVLLDALRLELKKDPITTTLVDVTKLQLVEITRKKIRKPLHEAIRE